MKKIFKYNLIFSFLLFFFFFISVNIVFALEINYPRLPFSNSLDVYPPQDFINTAPKEDHLALYVKYFYYLFLWISGIIALGGLIYGGILYLIAGSNAEKIMSAKEQITASFLGLLILLSSFLVFEVINPQIKELKIGELKKVSEVERPEIEEPPSFSSHPSLITTEIPFGRIIELIFETQENIDYEKIQRQEKPRMDRIKENANKTLEITEKLKNQNNDLKNTSHQCTCGSPNNSRPLCCDEDPGYAALIYGNACSSKKSCTSDSCSTVRGTIEDRFKKNLDEIENLKKEQKKTEEEIRLLRDELEKLEIAEKTIRDCNEGRFGMTIGVLGKRVSLQSVADFLELKNYLLTQKFLIEVIKMWDNINYDYYIKQNNQKINKINWDTLYCETSGNVYKESKSSQNNGNEINNQDNNSETKLPIQDFFSADNFFSKKIVNAQKQEVLEKTPLSNIACTTEVPIGEIIDRTKRIVIYLIGRQERMLDLGKQMIEATERMHNLISICSSRHCQSICGCSIVGVPCVSCPDSLCYRKCTSRTVSINESDELKNLLTDSFEGPCPLNEIDKHYNEKISVIYDLMKEVVSEEEKEKIGINPLIDNVISNLLKDLDIEVRQNMKTCVTDIGQGGIIENFTPYTGLFSCLSSIGANGPKWIIQGCCYNEGEFNDCLSLCFLEEGQENYKKCLEKCLKDKSQELANQNKKEEARLILTCSHSVNFYCCGH